MEKLLYYAAQNTEKAERLSGFTAMLGMDFSEILPVQSGQKIGWLAGVDGFTETKLSVNPPLIPEEMLIFCGIADGKLDGVLQILRESGLSVSLKAVMTAHNAGWTLSALYRELCAERAQFQKRQG